MNLPRWFQQAWPFLNQRRALIGEYQRMRQLQLVLADIGMRGSLWATPLPPRDLFQAGVNEGRRQMALEIFRIVKADPELLFAQVPAKPRQGAEK